MRRHADEESGRQQPGWAGATVAFTLGSSAGTSGGCALLKAAGGYANPAGDGAAGQRIDQPLAILLRVVKGSCEIAEAGRYVLLIRLLASAVTTAAPSLSRSVDGICLLSSTKSATGPSSDAKGSRRR